MFFLLCSLLCPCCFAFCPQNSDETFNLIGKMTSAFTSVRKNITQNKYLQLESARSNQTPTSSDIKHKIIQIWSFFIYVNAALFLSFFLFCFRIYIHYHCTSFAIVKKCFWRFTIAKTVAENYHNGIWCQLVQGGKVVDI